MKEIIINWLSKYFELILLINLLFKSYIQNSYIRLFLGVMLVLSIFAAVKTGKKVYSKTLIFGFIIIVMYLLFTKKIVFI